MHENIEMIVLKEENERLQEAITSLDSEIRALKSFMQNELGIKIKEQLRKIDDKGMDMPSLLHDTYIHRCTLRYIDIEVPHYRLGIKNAKEVLNKIEKVCGR